MRILKKLIFWEDRGVMIHAKMAMRGGSVRKRIVDKNGGEVRIGMEVVGEPKTQKPGFQGFRLAVRG